MKFVKLLAAAHIAGVLRHPHEGVLTVSDDDAKRLVDEEKIGEDVSADFADLDTSPSTEETTQEATGGAAGDPLPNPHQAEVETDEPPQPAPQPDTKPARRKPAAEKE